MKGLTKHFTITIDNEVFVPTVTEDEKYYYIEYFDNNPRRGFAVTKSSHMGAIKLTIINELSRDLKIKH